MKQRLEIIGPKVHGVGYRYFLMNQAMLQGVDGFTALNQTGKEGLQKVWVIIEGSADSVREFSAFAQSERPDEAEVSEVRIGDFEGFVPRMDRLVRIERDIQAIKARLGMP